MAWRSLRENTIDIKKEIGKVYTGTYHGSKEIDTDFGKNSIYQFTSETGERFGIYGFGHLNLQMASIKPGWRVQVKYLGKKEGIKNKFGKKELHQVELLYDDETIGTNPEEEEVQFPSEGEK